MAKTELRVDVARSGQRKRRRSFKVNCLAKYSDLDPVDVGGQGLSETQRATRNEKLTALQNEAALSGDWLLNNTL